MLKVSIYCATLFKTCFLKIDGTTIEANANRYTFTWGNAIKTHREKMKLQFDELWKYAQSIAASKLDDKYSGGFNKINKEKAAKTIIKTDAALSDKSVRYIGLHNR
jgi:hypothetical protein